MDIKTEAATDEYTDDDVPSVVCLLFTGDISLQSVAYLVCCLVFNLFSCCCVHGLTSEHPK